LVAFDSNTSVEAVTLVYGNVPLKRAVLNCEIVSSVCSKTPPPIYFGCDSPLLPAPLAYWSGHGPDGLGGCAEKYKQFLSKDSFCDQKEHAVNALIRIVKENPGEITLISLGPLT
jgi:purine nucleosidase